MVCLPASCRDVDKRLVTVPEIREVGEYVVEIKLHPDVTARVRLNIYAKWALPSADDELYWNQNLPGGLISFSSGILLYLVVLCPSDLTYSRFLGVENFFFETIRRRGRTWRPGLYPSFLTFMCILNKYLFHGRLKWLPDHFILMMFACVLTNCNLRSGGGWI